MQQFLTIVFVARENGLYLEESVEAAFTACHACGMQVRGIVVASRADESVVRGALAARPEIQILLSDSTSLAQLYNSGAAASEGNFLLFLQEGMILTAGGLQQLLHTLLLDEEIAAVGPFSDRTQYSWQYMNAESVAGDGENPSEWVGRHLTSPSESVFLEHFALLVRRSAFWQVGGFDAAFTGGGADVDLSFRLRYEGFHLLRAPVYLAHRGAETCVLYDLTRSEARPFLLERWGVDVGMPEHVWQEALGDVSWAHDLPLIRASARSALLRIPLVSILIPVDGDSEGLRETVESALAQTYPSIEIVVAGDERVKTLVAEYLDDLRVRCVRADGDRAALLRTCLRLAQGEYVQYCDVGDILLPDRITLMMDVLLSSSKISLVTAVRGLMDKNGAFVGLSEEVAPLQGASLSLDGYAVGRELLLHQINPLGTLPCALLRHKVLSQRVEEYCCEEWLDHELWLRLLAYGDVTVINRPLGLTRRRAPVHAVQRVRTILSWRRQIEEHWHRRLFLTTEEDVHAARASLAQICTEEIEPLLADVPATLRREYEEGYPSLHIIMMNRVEECAAIRLDQPLAHLAARGFVSVSGAMRRGDEPVDLEQLGGLRDSFILFERAFIYRTSQVSKLMTKYGAAGNVLLHELDDHPLITPKIKDENYFCFRAVSAVQTSTKYLADFLQELNPHIYLFENQLESLPERRTYDAQQKRVTIFFGALNRRPDWEPLMPAINEAIRRYGDRLYFRVISDHGFYEELRTEAKEFAGGMRDASIVAPYERYTAALHASDIALLPLRDTEFNRAKSDLKFIESAGHGAVALVSPTVYAGTVRDGETGLLYHSPKEFAEKLDLLIQRADLRRTLAENAYRYVAAHRLLDQHLDEYIAAYWEMFARREEFEQDRRRRVEEFFPKL